MFKHIILITRKLNGPIAKTAHKNQCRYFTVKTGTQNKVQPDARASHIFERRINEISKNEEESDSDVDQYMKIFNEKVHNQNTELTNKISEIIKDTPSGTNTFIAINEINKVNMKNTSEQLQIFLSQILNYNDSIRIFLKKNEKNKTQFQYLLPISCLFMWLCGSIYLYLLYKRNVINYESLIEKLIRSFNDSASKTFKFNVVIPIYNDHKNVTNCINFQEARNFVLIGPKSLGKTESIKHFCLTECLKEVLTIYIDLNDLQYSSNDEISLRNMTRNKLIDNYKGKGISNLNYNLIYSDAFSARIMEYIKDKNVNFVFDNYNHERDCKKVFNNCVPIIKKNDKWRSVIVSNDNGLYQNAMENDLEIKYINFVQTKSFQNYLFEKINSYCQKKVEFSNLEVFNEQNLTNYLKAFYYFSFEDLTSYLKSNGSLNDFIEKKDKMLIKKLSSLKSKNYPAYDLLNKLVKISGTNNDWNKLPPNTSYEHLIILEKFGMIFTKDFDQFVILNSKLISSAK